MCISSFLNDFAMILNSICKEIKTIPERNYVFLQNNIFHAAEGWKQFFFSKAG